VYDERHTEHHEEEHAGYEDVDLTGPGDKQLDARQTRKRPAGGERADGGG
jgi:hypothetical protein